MRDVHVTKVVSAVVLITFLTSNLGASLPRAAAAPPDAAPYPKFFPSDPGQIVISKDLGKVIEVFKGKTDKTVVLIQDAHAIPEAQRHIQKLIAHFQSEYGVRLVALEGAASKADPQIFKSFPDKKILKGIFEDYFERGELSGGNAAAIFSEEGGRTTLFHGVEDWPLYEAGLRLYLEAMAAEPGVTERLAEAEKNLEAKKVKAYSKDMLAADRLLSDFHRNRADLVSVIKGLAEIQQPVEQKPGSRHRRVPMPPSLELVLKETERSSADQSDVETQVKVLAEKVAAASRDEQASAFHQKYQEYQTSQVTPQAFALFLKEFILERSLSVQFPEALNRLAREQKKLRDIEGTRFFHEFEDYTEAVKKNLLRNELERQLDKESRRVDLMTKFARLELSREEWNEIKSVTRDAWRVQGKDLPGIGAYFAFYENAEKRDAAFLKNLSQLMDQSSSDQDFTSSVPRAVNSALLVAGGFHSQGLAKRLKERGISYVLVMPEIGAIPEASHYRDHMRGNVSWKSYFEIENGRISVFKAFVRAARDRLLGMNHPRESETLSAGNAQLLKSWRDQIIRDLAAQGHIEKSGDYTKFLDELQTVPGPIQKSMERIDAFLEGLRGLDSRKQLTDKNILKLFNPATVIDQSGAVLTGELFSRQLASGEIATAKSEVRHLPEASESQIGEEEQRRLRMRRYFGNDKGFSELKKNTEDQEYLYSEFLLSVKNHAMAPRTLRDGTWGYEWSASDSAAPYMRPKESLKDALNKRKYFNSLAFQDLAAKVLGVKSGEIPAYSDYQEKMAEILKGFADRAEDGKMDTMKVSVVHENGESATVNLKPPVWKLVLYEFLIQLNSLLVSELGKWLVGYPLILGLGFFVGFAFGGFLYGGVFSILGLFLNHYIKLWTKKYMDKLKFADEAHKNLFRAKISNFITEVYDTAVIPLPDGKNKIRDFSTDRREYWDAAQKLRDEYLARELKAATDAEKGSVRLGREIIQLTAKMTADAFGPAFWYAKAGIRGKRMINRMAEMGEMFYQQEKNRLSSEAIAVAIATEAISEIANSGIVGSDFLRNWRPHYWLLWGTVDHQIAFESLRKLMGEFESANRKKFDEQMVREKLSKEQGRPVAAEDVTDIDRERLLRGLTLLEKKKNDRDQIDNFFKILGTLPAKKDWKPDEITGVLAGIVYLSADRLSDLVSKSDPANPRKVEVDRDYLSRTVARSRRLVEKISNGEAKDLGIPPELLPAWRQMLADKRGELIRNRILWGLEGKAPPAETEKLIAAVINSIENQISEEQKIERKEALEEFLLDRAQTADVILKALSAPESFESILNAAILSYIKMDAAGEIHAADTETGGETNARSEVRAGQRFSDEEIRTLRNELNLQDLFWNYSENLSYGGLQISMSSSPKLRIQDSGQVQLLVPVGDLKKLTPIATHAPKTHIKDLMAKLHIKTIDVAFNTSFWNSLAANLTDQVEEKLSESAEEHEAIMPSVSDAAKETLSQYGRFKSMLPRPEFAFELLADFLSDLRSKQTGFYFLKNYLAHGSDSGVHPVSGWSYNLSGIAVRNKNRQIEFPNMTPDDFFGRFDAWQEKEAPLSYLLAMGPESGLLKAAPKNYEKWAQNIAKLKERRALQGIELNQSPGVIQLRNEYLGNSDGMGRHADISEIEKKGDQLTVSLLGHGKTKMIFSAEGIDLEIRAPAPETRPVIHLKIPAAKALSAIGVQNVDPFYGDHFGSDLYLFLSQSAFQDLSSVLREHSVQLGNVVLIPVVSRSEVRNGNRPLTSFGLWNDLIYDLDNLAPDLRMPVMNPIPEGAENPSEARINFSVPIPDRTAQKKAAMVEQMKRVVAALSVHYPEYEITSQIPDFEKTDYAVPLEENVSYSITLQRSYRALLSARLYGFYNAAEAAGTTSLWGSNPGAPLQRVSLLKAKAVSYDPAKTLTVSEITYGLVQVIIKNQTGTELSRFMLSSPLLDDAELIYLTPAGDNVIIASRQGMGFLSAQVFDSKNGEQINTLIGVTDFFREKGQWLSDFRNFLDQILPEKIKNGDRQLTVKILGSSSKYAYSFAAVIRKALLDLNEDPVDKKWSIRLQTYDLNPLAFRIMQEGRYPASDADYFPPEYPTDLIMDVKSDPETAKKYLQVRPEITDWIHPVLIDMNGPAEKVLQTLNESPAEAVITHNFLEYLKNENVTAVHDWIKDGSWMPQGYDGFYSSGVVDKLNIDASNATLRHSEREALAVSAKSEVRGIEVKGLDVNPLRQDRRDRDRLYEMLKINLQDPKFLTRAIRNIYPEAQEKVSFDSKFEVTVFPEKTRGGTERDIVFLQVRADENVYALGIYAGHVSEIQRTFARELAIKKLGPFIGLWTGFISSGLMPVQWIDGKTIAELFREGNWQLGYEGLLKQEIRSQQRLSARITDVRENLNNVMVENVSHDVFIIDPGISQAPHRDDALYETYQTLSGMRGGVRADRVQPLADLTLKVIAAEIPGQEEAAAYLRRQIDYFENSPDYSAFGGLSSPLVAQMFPEAANFINLLKTHLPPELTNAKSEVRAVSGEKTPHEDLRARINAGTAILAHGGPLQVTTMFTMIMGGLSAYKERHRYLPPELSDLRERITNFSKAYEEYWSPEAEKRTRADSPQAAIELEQFRTDFLKWIQDSLQILKEVEGISRQQLKYASNRKTIEEKKLKDKQNLRTQETIGRIFNLSTLAVIGIERGRLNLQAVETLLTDPLKTESVNFEDWFKEREGKWLSKGPNRPVRFHAAEGIPQVSIPSDLFHVAFERIWSNAARAMDADETTAVDQGLPVPVSRENQIVDVYPEFDGQNRVVRLRVQNPGKISDLALGTLFQIDYQRKKFAEGGVGLAFTRQAMLKMGGDVQARNILKGDRPFVEFILEFPAAKTDKTEKGKAKSRSEIRVETDRGSLLAESRPQFFGQLAEALIEPSALISPAVLVSLASQVRSEVRLIGIEAFIAGEREAALSLLEKKTAGLKARQADAGATGAKAQIYSDPKKVARFVNSIKGILGRQLNKKITVALDHVKGDPVSKVNDLMEGLLNVSENLEAVIFTGDTHGIPFQKLKNAGIRITTVSSLDRIKEQAFPNQKVLSVMLPLLDTPFKNERIVKVGVLNNQNIEDPTLEPGEAFLQIAIALLAAQELKENTHAAVEEIRGKVARLLFESRPDVLVVKDGMIAIDRSVLQSVIQKFEALQAVGKAA